ncbi:hypothetical protein KC866_03195 [Patescibacteria group bacterium]|nr:hypothetical protein [Patescibacteria group bacterium]
MRRIFIALLILLLIVWFEPWMGIVLASIYSFVHPGRYYDLIIAGVISDVVYQTLIPMGILNIPVYTTISVVLFFVTVFMKRRMNIYA